MKNWRAPLSYQLLFAVLLLMGFAPRGLEAQSTVPLKATILISETIQVLGMPPCILQGNISGVGVANRLGKLTVASTDCINPIGPTAFAFSSEHVVLRLANGNEIFARYFGTLTQEDSIGVIAGGFEITGGTGRYLGATGAGSVKGVEDMTTGKGQIQLVGTISF
jgi:hypothetical protein